MKIVIDTNVLVSAALVGKKPEEVVLLVVNNEKYRWVISEEILAEYKEVLSRRKLNLTGEKKQKWFDITIASPKRKNTIRRLGSATAQPNKIVGFHCVPPDLQEIGEGIDV